MTTFKSLQITLLAILAIMQSGAVYAACPIGVPSLEHEYKNAAMVFVGHVTSEDVTPESTNQLDGSTYTIHVEEALRGSRSKSVQIFSENTSGRFPMQVGATYLIFAHKELNRLQIDNCGNSGLLSEKSKALAIIRKIAP
ncbi:MAG: hypothetical protein QM706_01315 [Nitrospira sp.]